jgi:hypothetical protein
MRFIIIFSKTRVSKNNIQKAGVPGCVGWCREKSFVLLFVASSFFDTYLDEENFGQKNSWSRNLHCSRSTGKHTCTLKKKIEKSNLNQDPYRVLYTKIITLYTQRK